MLKKIIISTLAFAVIFLADTAFAALSCSVGTTCNSPNVIVLRMASTGNSHSELPSQSNYSQLVCCGGVSGLANSCANTFGVALRLSSDTNAHVEENTQSTAVYNGHNACLSVPSGGTVTIGYQNNNCNNFDTTVASISQTPTNAHIGNGSTYARKVCATATASSNNNNNNGGGGSNSGSNSPSPTPNPRANCRIADFNCDNHVNVFDLSILLYYYTEKPDKSIAPYDLKQDGKIDFSDVSIVFYYWDK